MPASWQAAMPTKKYCAATGTASVVEVGYKPEHVVNFTIASACSNDMAMQMMNTRGLLPRMLLPLSV